MLPAALLHPLLETRRVQGAEEAGRILLRPFARPRFLRADHRRPELHPGHRLLRRRQPGLNVGLWHRVLFADSVHSHAGDALLLRQGGQRRTQSVGARLHHIRAHTEPDQQRQGGGEGVRLHHPADV